MFLSDSEIKKINKLITPFNEDQLQPASYDLKLAQTEKDDILPGESMLGVTEEWIEVPNDMVGIVFGKSSIGRLFLENNYAGFVDPGFKGNIVLEFTNNSDRPLNFKDFDTIAQIVFAKVSGKVEKPYGECNNHYQNQKGILESYLKDVRS